MGVKQLTALLSITLIVAGIVSLAMKGGPLLSIDFTGGTIAQIKFDQAVDVAKLRITLGEYGFTERIELFDILIESRSDDGA